MRRLILVVFMLSVMVLGVFQLAVLAGDSEGDRNIVLTRQLFQDVWNKRNPDGADKIVGANCVFYSNGILMTDVGPGIIKKMIAQNLAQFPDFSLILEDVFACGNRVTFRYLFRGTYEKLKKVVKNEAIGILEFRDGKMVKMWLANNQLAVFQQLGFKMVPPSDLQAPKEPAKE